MTDRRFALAAAPLGAAALLISSLGLCRPAYG